MKQIVIKILFFGALKDYYGNTLLLAINEGDNLSVILSMLKEISTLGSERLGSCQLAINSTIVDADFVITEVCDLAILPPFSED